MNVKTCSKCNIEKSISKFNKHKTGKYGVRGDCKLCRKIYNKEYSEMNKEIIKKQKKKYYQDNKENLKEYAREFYSNNKKYHKDRYEIYKIMRKNK